METNLTLLDGAIPTISGVSKESQLLSAMVKDTTLSLVDRIESYEDIINIEVGDTALTRARNLEREEGIRQLYPGTIART
jgi:threonine synthase